jgi:uncharacterized protein (TIGR02246 family)
MKFLVPTLIALVAFAGAACTDRNSTLTPGVVLDDAQARKDINAVRSSYVEAIVAADAARVADLYSEDAIVLYPNHAPIIGRAAILDYFTAFFGELKPEHFQLTSEEIQVAGAWAFDRGTYQLRGVPLTGLDSVDDHGKYLVILQRQPDGSWKVARDMDNSSPPNTQSTNGAS